MAIKKRARATKKAVRKSRKGPRRIETATTINIRGSTLNALKARCKKTRYSGNKAIMRAVIGELEKKHLGPDYFYLAFSQVQTKQRDQPRST